VCVGVFVCVCVCAYVPDIVRDQVSNCRNKRRWHYLMNNLSTCLLLGKFNVHQIFFLTINCFSCVYVCVSKKEEGNYLSFFR
jgi:hypothetical protein